MLDSLSVFATVTRGVDNFVGNSGISHRKMAPVWMASLLPSLHRCLDLLISISHLAYFSAIISGVVTLKQQMPHPLTRMGISSSRFYKQVFTLIEGGSARGASVQALSVSFFGAIQRREQLRCLLETFEVLHDEPPLSA